MKIVSIASWPPRQCGIACFTADLRLGLEQNGYRQLPVIAVSSEPGEYRYGDEVQGEIIQNDPESYTKAARLINSWAPDAVILQHEYGLFGGPDGNMILGLLRDLKVPVITVLHTVLSRPSAGQYKVMCRLAEYSAKLVIIAATAQKILEETYGIEPEKVVHIPHGVPQPPTAKVVQKVRQGLAGPNQTLLMTFGLLGPGKGLELAIQAVKEIATTVPDFVYLIVGATHPNERKLRGEFYREELQKMIDGWGLSERVRLVNQFLSEEDLMAYLAASDVYLTPYPCREQISSGTLSFALGLGKPIVATPFIYAEEMLSDGCGVLVPFSDPVQMGAALAQLITDRSYREQLAEKARAKGEQMQWSVVAKTYAQVAETSARVYRVSRAKTKSKRRVTRPLEVGKLPRISLEHLARLTDDTGLLQHASGPIPNRQLGYTTDDNARALLAMALAPEELGDQALDLAEIYLAFLHFAQQGDGWFQNYFSYERQPLPETRSDDCQGRTLWGLATAIRVWSEHPLAPTACRLFQSSLPTWSEFTSVRGWALVILALATLLRDTASLGTAASTPDFLEEPLRQEYTAILEQAADKLAATYQQTAGKSWPWFENILSYSCGLLPAALFQAYAVVPKPVYRKVGEASLSFLAQETTRGGIFRPIGNRGWYRRGGQKAEYDQQPVEGWAMTLAAVAAYDVTQNSGWLTLADIGERWFLGQNDLGIALYDPRTGGCADGLYPEGISENQGAESTLAYILTRSLQEGVRAKIFAEVQEA